MKPFFFVALLCSAFLFTACETTSLLKEQQYAKLYEEKPTTIAIMPPINRTTHIDAKDFFYTTLYSPLCERGYYVFSPYLTKELFQQESAADAEQFIDGDLKKFGEVLGADALMFTIIKDWKRVNLAALITVDVEYILKSTRTNEILFQREGTLTVDNSVKTGGGGLFDLAASFIANAAQDKVIAGRLCSKFIFSDLPAGKYAANFGMDGKTAAQPSKVKKTIKK